MAGIEGFFGPLKYYRLHTLHPAQVSPGASRSFWVFVNDGCVAQGRGTQCK